MGEDIKHGVIRVSKLLVHPIKSCQGTSVLEANYTPEGLENDRKWCIVRADNHAVLTARDIPRMVLITPRIEVDHSDPFGGKLVVTFPEDSGCQSFEIPLKPTPAVLQNWDMLDNCSLWGNKLDGYICQSLSPSSSPSLPSDSISQYFGRPAYLVMKGPSVRACEETRAFPDLKASAVFQDGYPLLLASEESLAEVRKRINEYANDGKEVSGILPKWKEEQIEIERFRPNVVINGAGIPFVEDMIQELVISPDLDSPPPGKTHAIYLVSKCTRCLLPNVDTATGVRDAAVPFKVLTKFRNGKDLAHPNKPCFGVNGVPTGGGVFRVGDYVYVKQWATGPEGIES